MKSFLIVSSVCAVLSAGAVPTVSDVTLAQVPGSRDVRVDYTLSERAIVTWTLETNAVANASDGWVAVDEGVANTRTWGDINRRVDKAGACTFFWGADHSWDDQLVARGCARAVLTAWPTNNPPLYMVVDLFGGPCIRYYTSTNALPDGGLASDSYRTHKLVMRKIPAKDVIWTMGVPADIDDDSYRQFTDGNKTANAAHKVKLTYDYYIGIYELSRAHWGNLMDCTKGYGWMKNNKTMQDAIPAGGEYPSAFRAGNTSCFCGRLRDFHGSDYAFDVVSSAEWEFAYRAGEPRTLYSGMSWTSTNIKACGAVISSDATKPVHAVGTVYPPNRWGIYDLIGNVTDGTRDQGTPDSWQDREDYKTTGICVDPELTGSGYIVRGFNRLQSYQILEGDYWNTKASSVGDGNGYRIMCPIPNAD